MGKVIAKIIASLALKGDNKKKVFKVIIALLILFLFFPIIILQCINPFSSFDTDKSTDPYVMVVKEIQSEKNITLDVRLMRAVDTVLFPNDREESDIETRANKYYYTSKEVTEVVEEKDANGKTKKVEKKTTIYIPNALDQVIAAIKKDKKVSSDASSQINDLYQISLDDDSDNDSNSGGSIDGGGTVVITVTQKQFIQEIVAAVKKVCPQYHLFPSVTIAQAILESGSGSSSLASKYHNLFGIKADSSWTGAKVRMATKENYGGSVVTIMAYFRAYSDWDGSIEDHAKFLMQNSTYSKHGVFSASTYQQQAVALQVSGYATDPNYAKELVQLIQSAKLYQYDN